MSTLTDTNVTTAVKIGNAGNAAIQQLRDAKALAEQAQQMKASAEKVLRDILGEATVGTFRGITAVKVIASHNSSIDQKVLREAFPEAFEATYKRTPYTFLKAL